VRIDTCDYSVNPRFIGRRVDVRVTLTDVVVNCAGVEVARHARCLASHQTLTSPEHGQIARTMRVEHTVTVRFAAAVVEQRDLTGYDRIGAQCWPPPQRRPSRPAMSATCAGP
jgi:hypothetical protein